MTTPPANFQWQAVLADSAQGLRAFLAGRIDQSADVEDCLQTVFLKAVQSGKNIPPAARKAWLFRIAANESINFWRQRETSRRYTTLLAQTLQKTDEDPPSLLQQETRQRVQQQLRQLPDATQEIIRRKFDDEQTFQQIAESMNLPLGTVLTRMRRGLEKLRQRLEQE